MNGSPAFSLDRLTRVRDVVEKKGLAFSALEIPEGPMDPVRVRLSPEDFRVWRMKSDRAGEVTVDRDTDRDTALCVVVFGAQWFALRCWWPTKTQWVDVVPPERLVDDEESEARTEGAARDMVYGNGRVEQ